MSWFIISVIGALLILTLMIKTFKRRGGKLIRHPYQKHTALFSPDDVVFLRALREAVGDDYEVFAKIRVADMVLPKKSISRRESHRAFDPIAGRHFDFVLCDPNNLSVACAIQLHDKINPARQTEQRDDLLKPICEAISLPFVRFHIKADYPILEMRERLQKAMSKEPFYLTETDGRKEPRISNLNDLKF